MQEVDKNINHNPTDLKKKQKVKIIDVPKSLDIWQVADNSTLSFLIYFNI